MFSNNVVHEDLNDVIYYNILGGKNSIKAKSQAKLSSYESFS